MTMFEAACLYGDFSMLKAEIANDLSENPGLVVVHHDFDEVATTASGMTVTEGYINLDLISLA